MSSVDVEIKPGCEELFDRVANMLNAASAKAKRIQSLPPKNLQQIEVDTFYIEKVAEFENGMPFSPVIGYHWECSIPGVLIKDVAVWDHKVYVELSEDSLRPVISEFSKGKIGSGDWIFV